LAFCEVYLGNSFINKLKESTIYHNL